MLSGIAVLFYQPNIIVLFGAAFILFCSTRHLLSFFEYSVVGAWVVLTGIALSFIRINGTIPTSVGEYVGFITARNVEFRSPQSLEITIVKGVLAFGHDVLSAHWTRILDPVRNFLDPYIPGCVYNFNVVIHLSLIHI